MLRETTKLLGIQGEWAHVGFKYLQEGDMDIGNVELRRLGFRHAVRPEFEARAKGAPRFVFHSSSARISATVAHSMQLSGGVRSFGGPSRGLSVVVFGDALDRERVSITSVQLVVTVKGQQTVVSSSAESVLQGEQRISLARFPDLDIPAGSAAPADSAGIEETWESYQNTPRIHANVFGHGVTPGSGDVHIGFVPDVAPEGQAVASQRVEVYAPARKPLRAPESAQPLPQLPEHVLYAQVEDFFARRPSDGFSFGGSLIPHDVPGDAVLPTLALWFDLENVSNERAVAVEAWFEELIAEAMVRYSGVQALVGKATAMHVAGLDSTDYEKACGIHDCTLQRSWLTRFLRAVPVGTLWLGETLAQSIPDLRALEEAVRVESVGRALRLTIENERAAEEAEHALAALLPSAEDRRGATQRLYGR